MNRDTLVEDHRSTLLDVDANPVPLRLPIGSAIFAYSGEVWITQEGMQEDVILAAGERFDVRSRASIVASATKSPARVYVACPADAAASIDEDLFALLHRRARRLRTEEVNRMGRRTRRVLLSGLATVSASVSAYIRRTLGHRRACRVIEQRPPCSAVGS